MNYHLIHALKIISRISTYKKGKITDLSVAQYTDNFTVLDQLTEISLNNLLAHIILPLLSILSESFLLGNIPSNKSGYLITES